MRNKANTAAAMSLVVLSSILMLCVAPAAAQSIRSKPIVIREAQHDVSPMLGEMLKGANVQELAVAPVGTTAGVNFDGIAPGIENGTSNPDVNGSVGPTQYVQWQNTIGGVTGSTSTGQVAVWNKSGTLTMGPFQEKALWRNFAGPCSTSLSLQNIVEYDKAANVWVFVRHVYPTTAPNYLCFAVSQGSSVTPTTKFNRYAYALSSDQMDYPRLGIWPDAFYMSFNLLTETNPHTFINPMVCAFDRNGMIAGTANPVSVCFTPSTKLSTLLPSDLDGATPPPVGSPNYYLNLDTNSVDLWQFHVDFTTPTNSTFTGPTNILVPPFLQACSGRKGVCVPQLGTGTGGVGYLSSWSDRLMSRLAYRNFGDHESLLASHTVNPLSTAYAAIRWYEIRSPGTTPVVYQASTWQPDGTSRWLMSMAMDKVGDIAVGYSESSSTQYPAIAYTGQVPTDPLNTLESPENIISPACPAGQACNQVCNPSWGTYSSMSVDPVDDCTFWYTNQYYIQQGSKIWNTRIASFKFPSCQ